MGATMELSYIFLVGLLKYLLIFVASVLVVLYFYVTKDYNYWKKRGVRYVKPVWFFGNLEFLMRDSVWNFMYKLWQKNPVPYVGVFLGHKPALIVQSPELARRILTKDGAHFEDRYIYSGSSDPIGSLNLFTLKNPLWSELRRELSPIFTSSKLRTLINIMNFNAKELANRIEKEYIQKNKTVHLKDLFSRYTTDTVGYTVFGLRTSALNDDSNPLWQITTHMVKWTFWRGFEFSIIFLVPPLANLLRLKFFSETATKNVRNVFEAVVKERRESNSNSEKDLINILLAIKDNIRNIPEGEGAEFLDNVQLAQVAIFILGSIETSSTTMSCLMNELAYHPKEQEKLFNEIDEALKRSEKDALDFNDLLELKYLNSCIQETLRRHVPVPIVDRLCTKDYKIDENLTVEKGTPVYVNLLAIHYNEKNYDEPNEWRPERFTGVNSDSDNRNFTYMPFGEGQRFCIGKRYAMIQIRAAMVQIIHNYRIEPVKPYDVPSDPYSYILAPKDGGCVRFVPRR